MRKLISLIGLAGFSLLLFGCGSFQNSSSDYWCKYDRSVPAFSTDFSTLASENAPIVAAQKAAVNQTALYVFIFILICTTYFFVLRYVWNYSVKTGRSRFGFMILGVLFPFLAWVILLVLDVESGRKPSPRETTG
jgi:hypothetical protein